MMWCGEVKACREVSETKLEAIGTQYVALITGDEWHRKYCSLGITVEAVFTRPSSYLQDLSNKALREAETEAITIFKC